MADDNKPDYFDGIRSHFEETEIRIIEVPEWGLVGDKAIYAKPFNMMEKSKLFKGANNNDLNILIDVIIEKALDKDHKPMFNASHILSFKKKADTDVLARVASEIMGTSNESSTSDFKKN